jgi:nitroreductase
LISAGLGCIAEGMDILSFLQNRRSTPLKYLGGDGPLPEQIQTILGIASRVPDHNKLAPWWFVVFEGDAREKFGAVLKRAYLLEDPTAEEAKLALEAERFLRAPVVIAVISRIREGKAPQWEQILSAGAAAYNLCLAANAIGFGTNWLTEWMSYNPVVRDALGCDGRDTIAGFVYIGTQMEKPEERERPALSDIANHWYDGYVPSKGDSYGRVGMGIPRAGFDIENS